MHKYTIPEFIKKFDQKDRSQGDFELESDRVLEINLAGTVWIKMGSMVAYRGSIKFSREGILEQGLGTMFKRTISGEGGTLTKADGTGKLYVADGGKKLTVLALGGDSIYVNGSDLLAFQDSVSYEISVAKKPAGMLAGGLFNVKLSGFGLVAIGTHYDPVVLPVSYDSPVATDPGATVAWSEGLSPEIKVDASLKTFLGRGSGESLQMLFEGSGFVVVQAVEESPKS
jgi:uncharacterized protein (AIM24 family)